MSKDLAFQEMEQNNSLMISLERGEIRFPHTLTKKKAQTQGKEAAKALLDKGEVDALEALSNFARFEEVIKAFVSELRKNAVVPEKEYSKNGVKFTTRSSGDRYDYAQDSVYAELQQKLSERKELLDLARKSKDTIYDSEGVEVPKVGVKTYGKETLIITY